MATPPTPISMNASDVEAIKTAISRLAIAVACMGNRQLLSDAEAAAWLGYTGVNPSAYMVWLRHHTNLKSVKLQKLRRWRVADLEEFAANLPVSSHAAKPRKPRLSASA